MNPSGNDSDDAIEILDSPIKPSSIKPRPSGSSPTNLASSSKKATASGSGSAFSTSGTAAPIASIFKKAESSGIAGCGRNGKGKERERGKDHSSQDDDVNAANGVGNGVKRKARDTSPLREEGLNGGGSGGVGLGEAKRRRVDALRDAQPLAERLRPTSLSTFIGQTDLIGPGSLLHSILSSPSSASTSPTSNPIGSLILWGPPGCGKTTMARLIASKSDADFKELSATSSGTGDVRKVFEGARNGLRLMGRRTILFIDEIHRFTKPQQDLFLPFVENGWVSLIGATTENPSFKVNGALLSRCRVFTLTKLTPSDITQILTNALTSLPQPLPHLPARLIPMLADVSDGDARQALNSLELAVTVCQRQEQERERDRDRGKAREGRGDGEMDGEIGEEKRIPTEAEDEALMNAIKRGLRKGYDRTGEERYDLISAMHKSIRGSDGSAALYWLARMLEGGEDPLYVARRLVVVASEDVGLADSQGLPLAMATYQACQVIGMPECRLNLAHCVAYLSEAPKSIRAYEAYGKAVALANETPLPSIPLQIRNAPTRLMKDLGYGKDYSYPPGFQHPVHNDYMPLELADRSTLGSDSLLKTKEEYDRRSDKDWNEERLREWEWKRNAGRDWEGRS